MRRCDWSIIAGCICSTELPSLASTTPPDDDSNPTAENENAMFSVEKSEARHYELKKFKEVI